MPLDGLTLHCLTDETKNIISGARIEKIYMPSNNEILFNVKTNEGMRKLYFLPVSDTPRFYLTEKAPENPSNPPMFCMFLRKRMTNFTIDNIEQKGLDRLVILSLSGNNEIGDPVNYKIILELIPKHGNFIIINEENIILEALRKSDYNAATDRTIQPGFIYVYPPVQNKINIFEYPSENIAEKIFSEKNKTLSSSVQNNLEGFSPLVSRELAYRVTGDDVPVYNLTESHLNKLKDEINKIKNLLSVKCYPVILKSEDGKYTDFSFFDISQYGNTVTNVQFHTVSELIAEYFGSKTSGDRANQAGRELKKTVSNLLAKERRKYIARQNELEECKNKDKYRIYGELIMADQYNLKKGESSYNCPDFYNNYEPVIIPADPALSPSANAQKYFKEYNKLKTAEKLLTDLISQSETDIEYLESVYDSILRIESYSEAIEIKNELHEQGYLKKTKNSKKTKLKSLPPLEYVSDDGYLILAGRNNIQNETISFKTADKSDSWFHVQKMPGSHVVVIGNGDILPESTCRQAAIIAAYNSGARDSSGVAVDYTEIKELKKAPGKKPGMVIYHTYNTMWVTPDKSLCERLKKEKK